nr:MAG TPA: hypothetical protein [Caudoviricetes sp.]
MNKHCIFRAKSKVFAVQVRNFLKQNTFRLANRYN